MLSLGETHSTLSFIWYETTDRSLPPQDIEEVEEWNEYGEIKQNLLQPGDLPSTSTPTPSRTSTPSKPPPPAPVLGPTRPAETTSPLPKSLNVRQSAPVSNPALINPNPETPLTAAMRQASLEAAAKANASKAQKVASYGVRQAPSTLTPGSEPSDKNNAEALKKLDNSTAGDSVPPTGSTEVSEAKEPVADAKPMSEKSSVSFKGDKEKDKAKHVVIPTAPEEPSMKHRGSRVSVATAEEIKAVEEASKITEEPEEEAVGEEEGGKKGQVGETVEGEAGQTTKGEVGGSKKEVDKEVGAAGKRGVGGAKTKDATEDVIAAGEGGEKVPGPKTQEQGPASAKKAEGEGVKTEDATVADEEEAKLPGTRTQAQEAASAEKAGESVAD